MRGIGDDRVQQQEVEDRAGNGWMRSKRATNLDVRQLVRWERGSSTGADVW